MSEDTTLNEFVDSGESEEVKKPELIQGVAWSKIDFLPDDWVAKNIESDINILSGNNFSSDYFVEEGGVPLIRIRDLAENKTTVNFEGDYDSKYLINQQDLLVGMDGEFEPHLWSGTQALLNQRVCKIEPEIGYNKIFFRYAIEKPLFYIQKSIAGTTVKHLSQSNINDLNLPTPPLPEQRKIATVLYNVDQAIQKTQEVVEQANQLKKGFIQQFYSRGYYDHQEWQQVDMQDAYVMTRTDELPAAWDIKKSGDIAEVKTGHTPSTSVDEYWDGEISWVDIHDLTQLEGTVIHSTDDTITEEGLNNSGAKLLPEGTLVLCRTGAIGETAILGKEMATDQDQVTFECDESELLPRYLMYLFEYATPQLERLSAGSTHDKVQLHFFSDLEIPLPEIDEQREIVDVLKSVDEVSQANKEQLDNLHRVKRGLMQDLLSGTVRTTDTNIEVPDEIAQYG